MDFQLNDDQRQFADSLERLLNERYDQDSRKAIIAAGGSPELWKTFAELGLLSLPVSEAGGGFDGGAVDLLRPMALLGQALVVEPLQAQLVACRLLDRAISAAGNGAAAGWRERLAEALAGDVRISWVNPVGEQDGRITASHAADGHWQLSGQADGVAATRIGADSLLLVTAHTDDGGRALFVLDGSGTGLDLVTDIGLDRQPASRIRFDRFAAPAVALLGCTSGRDAGERADGIDAAIEDAEDFGHALLAAEAVGLIEFACATTLDYLKTRKQFGVPIGSFQALQHRIVDLYVELEQVRSMAALAASKVDAAAAGQIPAQQRRRAVSAARALVGRVADKVARESVQLHGGMGMAEELKVSHTFRRLTVLARQAGTVGWHLDRFIASNRD